MVIFLLDTKANLRVIIVVKYLLKQLLNVIIEVR